MAGRNAFTLTDLLISLACLGVLAGLLFPVVEQSRERARQVTCLDNLVTIGRASLEYDEVNGFLPPYLSVGKNSDNVASILRDQQLTYSQVQILPFLDEIELADSVDPIAFEISDRTYRDVGYNSVFEWFNGVDSSMPGISNLISGTSLAVLRCPSDPVEQTQSTVAAVTPSSTGVVHYFPLLNDESIPFTNYAANGGGIGVTTSPAPFLKTSGFVGFHGPIRSRESDSTTTVPDGASNVAMMGEALGRSGFFNYGAIDGRHAMIGGLAFGRADIYVGVDQLFGTLEESNFAQFGSPHPNTVNFVRCDGSVTIVNRNADSQAIGRFCGAADGLKFELDLIGDVNLDNRVDLQDVSPFSDLIDSNQFQNEADIDQNGTVDLKDVQPFVNLISNQ